MNLVIDVGNTRTKLAVFQLDTIVFDEVVNTSKIVSSVKKMLIKYPVSKGIIASVFNLSNSKIEKLNQLLPFLQLNHSVKIPFKNLYATPKTLGVDRIALVCAAFKTYKNQNCLVIDAGTCITYDFINANGEYLGGAIAPGLQMRYQSLHHFTSKLPMLNTEEIDYFIGNSTKNSMNSGVINGLVFEIEGFINCYQKKYPNLTVVLTGGDANFLSKQLKSIIFANQKFLLQGLNEILNFNNSL